jgi:hypothetical protein
LGCDSGGWYGFDHLTTILHLYVTEANTGTKAWRPDWVEDLRQRLMGRGLLHGMTPASWTMVLLKAVEPKQHQPPRYQLAFEKRFEQAQNKFVQPYAVRAASGHRSTDILDPKRIAATVPAGIASYVSGIFHITEVDNLLSIFRHGLHLGGMQRNRRMDVHFMAYFPTDPRNHFARQKLKGKRFKAKSNLVVLSICPTAFGQKKCAYVHQMAIC